MSANNPFNKGSNKSGKPGEDAARRVQQQSGGNRSGIGQRKGKPAPKPGVERSGGSSSGSSKSTPPGLPKNRPGMPGSGGQTSGSTRRGCGLPVGILTLLLMILGVAVLNR
jgi:hypothetical protein